MGIFNSTEQTPDYVPEWKKALFTVIQCKHNQHYFTNGSNKCACGEQTRDENRCPACGAQIKGVTIR